MLLNIDRVLQLLAEGKSVEKISELSGIGVDDICQLIEQARQIVLSHDRTGSRKKIILKKRQASGQPIAIDGAASNDATDLEKEIFTGAELSAVPVSSTLTMYADGISNGDPGMAGIGIVIKDREGRQVGQVSQFIGNRTDIQAEYAAIIRAIKIAIYFNTRVLHVRTDSELAVKQLSGDGEIKNVKLRSLFDEAQTLKKKINTLTIEHVSRDLNEKADYLAKRAIAEQRKTR